MSRQHKDNDESKYWDDALREFYESGDGAYDPIVLALRRVEYMMRLDVFIEEWVMLDIIRHSLRNAILKYRR